jgi:hypothetical protein
VKIVIENLNKKNSKLGYLNDEFFMGKKYWEFVLGEE